MDAAHDPAAWHDFGVALVSASAALLGLVFVVVSLHLGAGSTTQCSAAGLRSCSGYSRRRSRPRRRSWSRDRAERRSASSWCWSRWST